MILSDVNVLVTACMRKAESHIETRSWLIDLIRANEAMAIYEPVLTSVVRLCTDPRIWDPPATPTDAFQFCDMLRGAPNGVKVTPSAEVWTTFMALSLGGGIRGKRIPDAYLAALAIDLDATLYSFDKGFANYPGLKWRLPEI